MENKIFSFDQHGLNDHIFSLAALLVPCALKLPPKSIMRYSILAINLLAYNLISDHRYAAKRIIEPKTHKKIDIINVGVLMSMAFLPAVRKNKKELLFHLGYTMLAALHVPLSKWSKEPSELDYMFI